MKILILCCGKQMRFSAEHFKQLLLIEGEPLLHRTIRQLKSERQEDITVVAWSDILKVEGANFFTPAMYRTTCETLLYTKELWENETVILLGDVYYTDMALFRILTCNKDFTFFGDTGDFFALKFSLIAQPWLIRSLEATIKTYFRTKTTDVPLLSLYRYLNMPEHQLELIGDRTQDFDRDYEYQEFLNGKSKNRLFNAQKSATTTA